MSKKSVFRYNFNNGLVTNNIRAGVGGQYGTYPMDEQFQRYLKPFTVENGILYYLGDYYGETKLGRLLGLHTIFGQAEIIWKLNLINDNYEETTREFKDLYKNFTAIQTKTIF